MCAIMEVLSTLQQTDKLMDGKKNIKIPERCDASPFVRYSEKCEMKINEHTVLFKTFTPPREKERKILGPNR